MRSTSYVPVVFALAAMSCGGNVSETTPDAAGDGRGHDSAGPDTDGTTTEDASDAGMQAMDATVPPTDGGLGDARGTDAAITTFHGFVMGLTTIAPFSVEIGTGDLFGGLGTFPASGIFTKPGAANPTGLVGTYDRATTLLTIANGSNTDSLSDTAWGSSFHGKLGDSNGPPYFTSYDVGSDPATLYCGKDSFADPIALVVYPNSSPPADAGFPPGDLAIDVGFSLVGNWVELGQSFVGSKGAFDCPFESGYVHLQGAFDGDGGASGVWIEPDGSYPWSASVDACPPM